jgi:hypothetical protein
MGLITFSTLAGNVVTAFFLSCFRDTPFTPSVIGPRKNPTGLKQT